MELLQLQYFSAVAKFEHITKASEYLHVSQPTVSQMIARLEKELGVPLFDRVGRSISLNTYGKAFLVRTNEILFLLDNAVSEIHNIQRTINQKITIGGWAGSHILMNFIGSFSQKYPHIDISFRQSDNVSECDAFLFFSTSTEQSSDNTVQLLHEEILLAIPVENPLSKNDVLAMTQIENESIIGPHHGKPIGRIMNKYFKLAGINPKITLEYDTLDTLKAMLKMNMGIAFLPEKSWGNLSQNSSFRLVHVDFPHCTRTLYVSWHDSSENMDAIMLFVSYAKEYFKKL